MEIQEIVKTIVHNHMNSSAPTDVDKRGLTTSGRKKRAAKKFQKVKKILAQSQTIK